MIKSNRSYRIIILFTCLAVSITIAGFVADFYSTLTYPGTDLRNRVVGARLIIEGLDPYFFKWNPSFSIRLYDPLDSFSEIVSKVSVPPTVLALHISIAKLDYLTQKIIWLFVQWVTLLGIVLIFWKTSKNNVKQNLVLALSFFFANSVFWRFHINSGQIYVVYIGLLSIAWLLLNKKFKYREITSGFLAGITASLRPPYVLVLWFFLINRRYSFFIGGVVGILFGVFGSVLVTGKLVWQQYVTTMLGMTGFINLEQIFPPLKDRIALIPAVYPQIVEGFNSSVRNPLEGRLLENSALFEVLNAIDLSQKKEILVVSFFIAFSLWCWLGFKFNLKQKDNGLLFLFATVGCLASEFFIPIGRFSYYDIQWLLPLLIIVQLASPKQLGINLLSMILLVGLILSTGAFSLVPRSIFLSTYAIAFYTVVMTIVLAKQTPKLGSKKSSSFL